MGTEGLTGLADSGYYSLVHLKGCEDRGMDVYVPIPEQPACKGNGGRFGSEDFRYDAQDDTYVCPAGQRLARSKSTPKRGKLYSCIARRQRFAGSARCRADAWQRGSQAAKWSVGSMRT